MAETKQTLLEIAEGIAEVTREMIEDNVHWQLSVEKYDGESEPNNYNAIHKQVVNMAIGILFNNNL
jgi:hypothetical protein